MDAETALDLGISPENLHQLPNGTYVHRGMFESFGPNANCTIELCPIEWSPYQYRPSLPANITFMVLFAVGAGGHIYISSRWGGWSYTSFITVGCMLAVLGYAGRVLLWTDPWSYAGFMIQMVFVSCAPVLFTAAIYVTLSRAIRFYAVEIARLPPRIFYIIFISADMLCLVFQAAGGALSAKTAGASATGTNLGLAGLILQVVVIFIFCGFFIDYMIRYIGLLKSRRMSIKKAIGARQRLFFGGLGSAILLILARSVYRVDELSEGYIDSDKLTNETLFIVLEGVLIILAVFGLLIGHPGLAFWRGDTAARLTAIQLH